MATKTEKKKIELAPLNLKRAKFEIRGKTPLLMDKFPESKKEEILEKQITGAKSNKELRNADAEIELAIHRTSNGDVGFPSVGFKMGMMHCTGRVGDKFFSKPLVQGAVRITNSIEGLILLKYKKQDVLKHSIGANTKFSPQFHDWSCELEIEYEANNISLKALATLLNYAGFYVGLGMWRPKGKVGATGDYGMYEVV